MEYKYPDALPTEPNGVEPLFTEDDVQRELFGPRGVPGKAVSKPFRRWATPACPRNLSACRQLRDETCAPNCESLA